MPRLCTRHGLRGQYLLHVHGHKMQLPRQPPRSLVAQALYLLDDEDCDLFIFSQSDLTSSTLLRMPFLSLMLGGGRKISLFCTLGDRWTTNSS
jgi:hypothetical protein